MSNQAHGTIERIAHAQSTGYLLPTLLKANWWGVKKRLLFSKRAFFILFSLDIPTYPIISQI